ncbi:hypothetical protein SDC9_158423 [bioreactor metagenome]|uniref:Uncharacterized protein n=1 Tax=bioreactor metagenome TaxID=1076179 RepID=A0A645FC18_9ZZZZ
MLCGLRGLPVQVHRDERVHAVPFLQLEREVGCDYDIVLACLRNEWRDALDLITFPHLIYDVPPQGHTPYYSGAGSVGSAMLFPGDHYVSRIVIESAQGEECIILPVSPPVPVHFDVRREGPDGRDLPVDPSSIQTRHIRHVFLPEL